MIWCSWFSTTSSLIEFHIHRTSQDKPASRISLSHNVTWQWQSFHPGKILVCNGSICAMVEFVLSQTRWLVLYHGGADASRHAINSGRRFVSPYWSNDNHMADSSIRLDEVHSLYDGTTEDYSLRSVAMCFAPTCVEIDVFPLTCMLCSSSPPIRKVPCYCTLLTQRLVLFASSITSEPLCSSEPKHHEKRFAKTSKSMSRIDYQDGERRRLERMKIANKVEEWMSE